MKPKTYSYVFNGIEVSYNHELTDAEMREWYKRSCEGLTYDQLPTATDWLKHGVVKRGTFDSNGMPTNWHCDFDLISDGRDSCPGGFACSNDSSIGPTILRLEDNGDVYLRGEFNQELTDERKKAMGK